MSLGTPFGMPQRADARMGMAALCFNAEHAVEYAQGGVLVSQDFGLTLTLPAHVCS